MPQAIDPMRLLYFVVLLVAIVGWALAEYRGRMGQALRAFMAWGMIFLAAIAAFGMWGDISQTIRPVQEMTAAGKLSIPRAPDGHYYPRLLINGKEITFMADTGASGVVLAPKDAARLGINPKRLTYVNRAMTANGLVGTAAVTLHNVQLGPFHDAVLPAQVNQAPMDVSLLGMDYLGRFTVQISGNHMVLSR